jgi:hypothetical protein
LQFFAHVEDRTRLGEPDYGRDLRVLGHHADLQHSGPALDGDLSVAIV